MSLAASNLRVLLLCLLGGSGAIYAGWLAGPFSSSWAGGFEWAFTAGILAMAVAAAVAISTGSLRTRTYLGAGLMAAMTASVIAEAAGAGLFEVRAWGDARYSTFLAALLGVTTIGLVRRWFVARWLAMALAVGGLISAGLNLAPWATVQSGYTWMLAIHMAGALIGLSLVGGQAMREYFEKDAADLWQSSDPMIRALRWTLLAHFVAIPMLLVYAWLQPIVPATQGLALALAAWLSAAVALTVARRLLGAVMLVMGAIALLIHVALTCAGADAVHLGPRIATYYAIFWTPAALSALLCGWRMAGPFATILRRH